jgi:hypothetical protein
MTQVLIQLSLKFRPQLLDTVSGLEGEQPPSGLRSDTILRLHSVSPNGKSFEIALRVRDDADLGKTY